VAETRWDEVRATAQRYFDVARVAALRWWRQSDAWLEARVKAALGSINAWRARRAERRASAPPASTRASSTSTANLAQRTPRGIVVTAAREDDAASVIGRLDTADDIDVMLVVPRGARRLREAGAWTRIAAHARQQGIALRVVSPRGDVRDSARANGLVAARSARWLPSNQATRISVGERDFDIPALGIAPVLRLLAVVALAVFVVGGACYAIPSARITVVPPFEPLTDNLRVRINALATDPDPELGVAVGTTIRVEVTTLVSTVATGTTTVGDQPATAELRFVNGGTEDVEIRAGTEVRTEDEVLFIVDGTAVAPAGGNITVTATADEPGTGGNVGAGTIVIPSGLPETVTVANPVAAIGGTDAEVTAVAQEDVDLAATIADEALRLAGQRALEAQVGDAATLFPETISVAILRQQALRDIDEPAQAFLMEYTGIISGVILAPEEGARFAEAHLREQVGDGRVLLPGTGTLEVVGGSILEAGGVTADVTVSGLVTDPIDPEGLRGELTGVSPEEASQRLQDRLELKVPPTVTISPTWVPWRWTPRRADRIEIVLTGPQVAGDSEGNVQDEDGRDEATPAPTSPDGGPAENVTPVAGSPG